MTGPDLLVIDDHGIILKLFEESLYVFDALFSVAGVLPLVDSENISTEILSLDPKLEQLTTAFLFKILARDQAVTIVDRLNPKKQRILLLTGRRRLCRRRGYLIW